MQHYQSSAKGDTSSDLMLNDISIASPSVLGAANTLAITAQNQSVNAPVQQQMQAHQQPQAADDCFKKAKLRLETVCLLLAENGANQSLSEKEKQQAAITNVLEEIIGNQTNKFDAQCLRLLMDYQWQAQGNVQTFKLQEELAQVKKRFEVQTQLQAENKEMKEQLARQKAQQVEQDRVIRQLQMELNQVKNAFDLDHRETRIVQVNHQQEQSKSMLGHGGERASSQQNRRSNTLVPRLDLSKVKGYEDHLREKAAMQKQKENSVPKAANSNAYSKPSTKPGSLEKKSHNNSILKNQNYMQTIQHNKSTKINNFIGAEVNLTNLNTLVAQASKMSMNPNKNSSNHQKSSYQVEQITSHSLSPSSKSKGRNYGYLNQMRHSQENRPTASNYYGGNQQHQNQSMDQVRQLHNYSETIEGSRMQHHSTTGEDLSSREAQKAKERMMNNRKRSMPPAHQVHIPLLDFSKLHQPQPQQQKRPSIKATQPKQSMGNSHSKQQYQTIEAGQAISKLHNFQAHQHQTIQPGDHPLYGAATKKRSQYEHQASSQSQHGIGVSHSMKVMSQQIVPSEEFSSSTAQIQLAAVAAKKQQQFSGHQLTTNQTQSSAQSNKYMAQQQQPKATNFKSDFNTAGACTND